MFDICHEKQDAISKKQMGQGLWASLSFRLFAAKKLRTSNAAQPRTGRRGSITEIMMRVGTGSKFALEQPFKV
jgi:hypothetical protein